jgi:hypothetical protein
MNLQGRALSIEMQGDDLQLLQSEVRQLGCDIPDDEGQEALIGPGTHEGVVGFQEANRLEPTGVVDERTAGLINIQVEARRPMAVCGQVRQPDANKSVPAALIELRPHFGSRMSAGLRHLVKQAGGEFEPQGAHAGLWFKSFEDEIEPPFMASRQPGEER